MKLRAAIASAGLTLVLVACGSGGSGSDADRNVCAKAQDLIDGASGNRPHLRRQRREQARSREVGGSRRPGGSDVRAEPEAQAHG